MNEEDVVNMVRDADAEKEAKQKAHDGVSWYFPYAVPVTIISEIGLYYAEQGDAGWTEYGLFATCKPLDPRGVVKEGAQEEDLCFIEGLKAVKLHFPKAEEDPEEENDDQREAA